jgi:hypothetical protein
VDPDHADRVGSADLPLTHELLAQIVAVRRPYLTGLMQDLPTLTIHDAVLRQVIERAREAPVRGR